MLIKIVYILFLINLIGNETKLSKTSSDKTFIPTSTITNSNSNINVIFFPITEITEKITHKIENKETIPDKKVHPFRKKGKRKRKFNKDCILKKIKSRFFKYFINKHMLNFVNHVNNQKVHKFKSKICFSRLNDYFIKDITIKRNVEWGFVYKTPFELFFDYSKINLEEINTIYRERLPIFKNIIKNLDELTEFVLFKPFGEVFNTLMKKTKWFSYLFDKVKMDIENKNKDNNFKDMYFNIFTKYVNNFVHYYQKKPVKKV